MNGKNDMVGKVWKFTKWKFVSEVTNQKGIIIR